MKKYLSILLIFFVTCIPPIQETNMVKVEHSEFKTTTVDYSVHFSPKGGCTQAIVNLILSAKTSIRMLAYSFTSDDIANALIEAGKKGIDVQVVLDKSNINGNGTKINLVKNSGVVKVFIDRKHAIAHNKVILVDTDKVELGSFNYTKSAEINNSENCLILRSSDIAKEYQKNWELHKSHSLAE